MSNRNAHDRTSSGVGSQKRHHGRIFVRVQSSHVFSVKGAVASANLYSLVETAKANGVEPHAYLSRLFTRLPLANKVEDFEALLPWNLKAEIQAVVAR